MRTRSLRLQAGRRAPTALAWLAGAVALAAGCGGEPRILLELQGTFPAAKRVDVVLLEPVVAARVQRRNALVPAQGLAGRETVYYLAQRAAVRFELAPTSGGEDPVSGRRFEIRDGGAPYVPLVIVRDAAQAVIGMGVYSPGSIVTAPLGVDHIPDAVSAREDVTLYEIPIEAARGIGPARVGQVLGLAPGDVLPVLCRREDDAPRGGLVWRRQDDSQLRFALPLDGGAGAAEGGLAPPDLDCDEHSAGGIGLRSSLGDQRDCDDTTWFVHADASERCSLVDEDCDPSTQGVTACVDPVTCPAGLCACDGDRALAECARLDGLRCTLPADSGGSGQLCQTSTAVVLPSDCEGACRVVLQREPQYVELKLNGKGEGQPIDLARCDTPVLARASAKGTLPAGQHPGFASLSVRCLATPTAPAAQLVLVFVADLLGCSAEEFSCTSL
jgi:hypothetical protein